LFDNLQKRVEESKQRGLAVYQDFEKFSDFITELRKSLAAAECMRALQNVLPAMN